MMKKIKLLFIVSLLVLGGCQKAKTPAERLALDFIDAYYVNTDPVKALPFTDRLAHEKVNQSITLIQADPSSVPPKNTRPRVSYKALPGAQENAEEGQFIFVVKIKPYESSEMLKKVMIRVRLVDVPGDKPRWKVTQFTDEDLPATNP